MSFEGTKTWAGKTVWHGCDPTSLASILTEGIMPDRFSGGYFGYGFYVAENRDLAVSNYAERDEEGIPSVVEVKISENARILDLRDPNDWIVWRDGRFDQRIHLRGTAEEFVSRGIDGVFDNSMGGLCIYNPAVLKLEPRPVRALTP